MAVNIKTNARGWYEGSNAFYWTARVVWDTGSSVYAVTQDSGATPKLRVGKGNAYPIPTSFTEQDSANNKAVTDVTKSYSSWLDTAGFIHVLVFTATNTLTHYRFNTATDLWTTGYGNLSTAAAFVRNVRLVVRSDGDVVAVFCSSADDADLARAVWEGASWAFSATGWASLNSTVAACIQDLVIDGADLSVGVYYDPAGTDISYGTMAATGTTVTAGVDLTATASASTLAMAGARYNTYDDAGTDKIIAAYFDSTGDLIERTITLESTANAANLDTAAVIEATNTGPRTPASTAVIGGVPYAAWWDDANSGTIKVATKSGSSWNTSTDFATGITGFIEIVPIDIGLAVVYQSGSDTVMDWIISPGAETGTATVGTASSSGGVHTASAGASNSATVGKASAGSYIQNTMDSTAFTVGSLTAEGRGQSITAEATTSHASVLLRMSRTATVSGNVWVEVQSHATDRPSGTVLYTSDLRAKSSLSTSTSWQEFTFPTPYSMTSGTRYWFCFKTDVLSDTENMIWRGGALPDQWDNEGISTLNDGVWSAAINGNDHSIIIPTLTQGFAGVGATGTATAGAAGAAGGTHTAAVVGASVRVRVSWVLMTIPEASGVASSTGNLTRGQATAAGGTHTGLGQVYQTGNHTVGTSTATGFAVVGTSGTRGVAVAGSATSGGGAHSSTAGTTGTTTVGLSGAAGGTHTGSGVVIVHATGNATTGTATASGAAHTAGSGATGLTTLGNTTAAGGTHTGTGASIIHATGTATVGTASAIGGSKVGIAGGQGAALTGLASASGGAHLTAAHVANSMTRGTATATGGSSVGIAGTTGSMSGGSATSAGGAHTGGSGARGTPTTGTTTAQGGSHTMLLFTGDTALASAGAAVAIGFPMTATGGATATGVRGQATAAGGNHTATSGTGATGNLTRGQSTATGFSTTGRAGTTGLTITGASAASGGSHTGTVQNPVDDVGYVVVGTATAAGNTTSGLSGVSGLISVVGATAAVGGQHTGTSSSTAMVVVGTATAGGGLHSILLLGPLDEYIPSGKYVDIIPAGRDTSITGEDIPSGQVVVVIAAGPPMPDDEIPAGRFRELIPAGKR